MPDPEACSRLAAGRLARVEALIEAAHALLAKERAERDVEEALGMAIRDAEGGVATDALMERAAELEERASIAGEKALAAAGRADAFDPWPPGEGAAELAELARQVLQEADELIGGATGSDDEAALVAWRGGMQEALDKLSTSLLEDR